MNVAYLDTSALAKWYLNERASDDVEAFIQSEGTLHISSLTSVEFRCLLARRRRAGEISAEIEQKVFATYQQDISGNSLIVDLVQDKHFDVAIHLIGSLNEYQLRSLDALHLAIIREEGYDRLATADRVMAEAAKALGLEIVTFF